MEVSLGSVITVLAFVIFVGIVVWAYSKRRKRAFDDAANAPFALPDEKTSRGMRIKAKAVPTAQELSDE